MVDRKTDIGDEMFRGLGASSRESDVKRNIFGFNIKHVTTSMEDRMGLGSEENLGSAHFMEENGDENNDESFSRGLGSSTLNHGL